MSKKTQKKSLKKPSKPALRAASKKSAAKPPVRKRPAKAVKPSGKTGKHSAAKASHRGASKPLKPERPKAAAKSTELKTEKAVAANPLPHGGLAEGTKAPAFRLPRDGDATVALSDFAGQKLVLFFYPRADTPGCTKEAIDFTRLAKAFAASGTALLGVSADPPKAQEAFRNKHQLSVPLASDEQHAMLEAYGVWGEKSMYGRTFLGISRTTVLIGPDGRIIRMWRNVKVDGHADEVLAAAQRT
ncbi:MAG TPA: peroxiredoxin [Bradyrhizobium sp.]